MRGKLIVIEGIDGVGKNTQSKMLQDYIIGKKEKCELFSFPRYDTPTGKKIAYYLNNGGSNLTLIERSDLYSEDRLAARDEILKALDDGVDVVCDRYVHSNIAYFTAIEKIEAPDEPPVMEEIIKFKEFEQNKLPQIDVLIILSLPTNLSKQLVANKAKRSYTEQSFDVHEKDIRIQNLANAYYNSSQFESNIILCNTDDSQIMSPMDIHNIVVSKYELSQV